MGVKTGLVLAGAGVLALGGCAVQPLYPVDPGAAPAPLGGPVQGRPGEWMPRVAPAQANPPPQPQPRPPEPQVDLRGRQPPGIATPRMVPPSALETPRQVTVRADESLYDVAERVRTPLRAIIDLNGLKPPYAVVPGQVLRIPPPLVYPVRAGDTLFGISRRYSIDPRSLANLNDIDLATPVTPGQRLALPALVKDAGPNREASWPGTLTAVGVGPATAVKPALRPSHTVATILPSPPAVGPATAPVIAKGPDVSAPSSSRAPTPPSAPEDKPASSGDVAGLGKGQFIWPVRGEILSAWGPKGGGQRNDGVNIAARIGDPVHAARGGTVVYAGNSVPAFGNLVLIKHPGGWATLYANLGKITVRNNAVVTQGQEIGLAGRSGAVDQPQVHFEVRYASKADVKAVPYDPASVLPPR